MLEAGLDVGLGTDGPMSGNTLDVMSLLGYTAKLHKLANLDRRVMKAKTVVEMATIRGARAINMGDEIGSLEVGKLADLLIVGTKSPHMIPMYDVYSALVFAAKAEDIHTVVIHGRVVVKDREVQTVDVEKIKRDVPRVDGRHQEEGRGAVIVNDTPLPSKGGGPLSPRWRRGVKTAFRRN